MSSIQSRGASRLESFEQKAAVLEAKIGKLEGREAKYGLSKSDTKKISDLCTDLIKNFNKLDATDQKVVAPVLQKNITWASSRGASNKLTALIPRTEIQIKQLLGASNAKPVAEVKSSGLTKSQEQLRDFTVYKDQKNVIVSNTKAFLNQFSQEKINTHIEKSMGLPLNTVKKNYEKFRDVDKRLNDLVSKLKQEKSPEGKEIIRERVQTLQKARDSMVEEMGPQMETASKLYGAHAEINEKISSTSDKLKVFGEVLNQVKKGGSDPAKLQQLQNTININVNYLSDLTLGFLNLIEKEIEFPKPPEKEPSPPLPKEPNYPPPPDAKKMSRKEYALQITEIYPGKVAEIKEKYTNALAKHIRDDKAREKAFNDATVAFNAENPAINGLKSLKKSLNASSGKAPELNDISQPLNALLEAFSPKEGTLSPGDKKFGSFLNNLGVGDYKSLKADLTAKNVNKANNLASSLISLNTRLFGEYSFEKKNLGNVKKEELAPKLSDLSAQHHNVELAIFSAITSGVKIEGAEGLFKEMLSSSKQLGQIYQKIGPQEGFSKLTSDEKRQLKENLQTIGKNLLQVENKLRTILNAIDAKKEPNLKDAANTLLAAAGYTGASADLLARCFP